MVALACIITVSSIAVQADKKSVLCKDQLNNDGQ